MGKGKLASLIGLGLLLGCGAFQIRQDAKEGNEAISGHDMWMYESCLKLNEAKKDIPSSKQQDCLTERMDASDE